MKDPQGRAVTHPLGGCCPLVCGASGSATHLVASHDVGMTCIRVHSSWPPGWESDPNSRHWNIAVGMSQLPLRPVETCSVQSHWGLWWDSRGEKGLRNTPFTESIQASKFQLCFPHKKKKRKKVLKVLRASHSISLKGKEVFHWCARKQNFIHLVLPRKDVTGSSDVESTLEWNSSPYITRKFVWNGKGWGVESWKNVFVLLGNGIYCARRKEEKQKREK